MDVQGLMRMRRSKGYCDVNDDLMMRHERDTTGGSRRKVVFGGDVMFFYEQARSRFRSAKEGLE